MTSAITRLKTAGREIFNRHVVEPLIRVASFTATAWAITGDARVALVTAALGAFVEAMDAVEPEVNASAKTSYDAALKDTFNAAWIGATYYAVVSHDFKTTAGIAAATVLSSNIARIAANRIFNSRDQDAATRPETRPPDGPSAKLNT